jgi:hypothetical protein
MALMAVSCAHPVYHATGGATFPAREPTCEFDVRGSVPGPGYVEIGQLTIEGDRSMGAGSFSDPNQFANRVRGEVCAVGGDALVTEVNGFGIIARGVVFHKTDEVAPKLAPTPAVTQGEGCEPICSPGFRCMSGACIPQCNPACAPTEKCGNDRVCHAREVAK